VEGSEIDLRKEQQSSLARPRYPYSAVARMFFRSMDMLVGSETTLAKAKLVEILAPVPYRAWETHQHTRMERLQGDQERVHEAGAVVTWGREARDNELWHTLVLEEKMRADSMRKPWFLSWHVPALMVAPYRVLQWTMARVAIRRAFLLNAEFEDHAEHTYAQLVADHPEWEDQPVESALAQEYGSFGSWADVFRRVGLDERDHMNNSFVFGGRPENAVKYDGALVVAEERSRAA
jgi:ubiquinol oxidase